MTVRSPRKLKFLNTAVFPAIVAQRRETPVTNLDRIYTKLVLGKRADLRGDKLLKKR